MARLPRLTAPGLPHHLIHRGNNRQAIFVDDSDRSLFLHDLADLSKSRGVAIHAYVLMPNHVHLLATPQERESLPGLMQALGRRYVRRFNDRHQRTGTLWEGRYRSTVVDTDRYLLACMRYIDMNPVRAGLIEAPELFGWSSHAHYIGLRADPMVSEHAAYWALGNTPFDRQIAYRRLFDVEQDLEEVTAIRYSTHHGWALGRPSFTDEVAGSVNRPARPRQAGRPRKRPEREARSR